MVVLPDVSVEYNAIKLNSVNSLILSPPLPGMGFDKMEVIAMALTILPTTTFQHQ